MVKIDSTNRDIIARILGVSPSQIANLSESQANARIASLDMIGLVHTAFSVEIRQIAALYGNNPYKLNSAMYNIMAGVIAVTTTSIAISLTAEFVNIIENATDLSEVQRSAFYAGLARAFKESFNIAVPCFLKGTLIKTPDGDVPVETLKDGDKVNTAYGVETVINIHHELVKGGAKNLPYLIPKDFQDKDQPYQDLYLSPDHGIFVGKKPTDNQWLLPKRNQDKFKQVLMENFEYYHIKLSGDHDKNMLYANGLLCDSWDGVVCDDENTERQYKWCHLNNGVSTKKWLM